MRGSQGVLCLCNERLCHGYAHVLLGRPWPDIVGHAACHSPHLNARLAGQLLGGTLFACWCNVTQLTACRRASSCARRLLISAKLGLRCSAPVTLPYASTNAAGKVDEGSAAPHLALGSLAQQAVTMSESQAGMPTGTSGRMSWEATPNMICTLLSPG